MARVRGVVLGVALVFLGACASMQTAQGVPISSTQELAGQWVGTVDPGRWGPATPFQLTIMPDGTLTATWDSTTAWGTVTVRDGRGSFEMHPALHEGRVRLFTDGGQRQMILDDDFRQFQARVVRQK